MGRWWHLDPHHHQPSCPAYLGASHRPFVPSGPAISNLTLPGGVTIERLWQRRTLLPAFDTMRRDLDSRGELTGIDAFTTRALELVTASQVRDAFDVNLEPESVRSAYGTPQQQSRQDSSPTRRAPRCQGE